VDGNHSRIRSTLTWTGCGRPAKRCGPSPKLPSFQRRFRSARRRHLPRRHLPLFCLRPLLGAFPRAARKRPRQTSREQTRCLRDFDRKTERPSRGEGRRRERSYRTRPENDADESRWELRRLFEWFRLPIPTMGQNDTLATWEQPQGQARRVSPTHETLTATRSITTKATSAAASLPRKGQEKSAAPGLTLAEGRCWQGKCQGAAPRLRFRGLWRGFRQRDCQQNKQRRVRKMRTYHTLPLDSHRNEAHSLFVLAKSLFCFWVFCCWAFCPTCITPVRQQAGANIKRE